MSVEKSKNETENVTNEKKSSIMDDDTPVENTMLPNTILFNKTASANLSNVYGVNKSLIGDIEDLTWRNTTLLKRFLSPGGRILSYRFTGLARKQQSQVKRLVKIARRLAVL